MVDSVDSRLGFFNDVEFSSDKNGKITGSASAFAKPTEKAYQAHMALAEKKESDKKVVNERIEALANLELMVSDLKNKSNFLFNSNTMSEVTGNYGVFANNITQYSSNSPTQTPPESLLDINLGADTNLQQFTLEVTQTASYDSAISATGVADPLAALNWAGPLTVNGHTINITADMSLNDIKNTLNRQSAETVVKANIVTVANGDSRLAFQATTIGSPITIVNATNAVDPTQLPAESGATADSLAAKFKFNNIPMVRQTNNIDDVVNGLTVVLKKQEPGTVITTRISPDVDSVRSAIQDWVKAINLLNDEVNKNKQYDPKTGAPKEDALLFNTDIIHQVEIVLQENLFWSVGGGDPTAPKYLEDIGLNVDLYSHKINIDPQILEDALQTNFDGVKRLFEYEDEVANTKFSVTDHPYQVSSDLLTNTAGNALTTTVQLLRDNIGNFTAQITINDGPYAGNTFTVPNAKINVKGENLRFSGDDIVTDAASNPYRGFTFVYTGVSGVLNNTSDTTTIKFSQGYGDRLGRSMSKMTEFKVGVFALQKDKFSEKIEKLDMEIDKITQAAEKTKKQFQESFAKFEAARQALAPLEGMIKALQGSMSKG
jgi:flagellar hook-associated protein 2